MNTDYRSQRAGETAVSDRIDGPHVIESHVVGAHAPGTVDLPYGVPIQEPDAIRWGPILAGVVTALAVMLFFSALGLALGFSALSGDPNQQPSGDWLTAAGIWGGLSLLLSFFFGGWMAGRGSAANLDRNGLLNGFVTGAATLLLLVWLAATTLTGALGFVGSTIGGAASAAAPAAIEAVTSGEQPAPAVDPADAEAAVENPAAVVEEVVPEDVQAQAEEVVATAGDAAAGGAWGTFLVMLLGIGAAAVGGMLGQTKKVVVAAPSATVTR